MAKRAYDLACKTGEYTDSSGQTKGRWQNVGTVMEADDGGLFVLLNRTFNPAGVPNPDGRDNVMLSMFEPKERSGGGAPQRQQAPSQAPQQSQSDDDIPF